MVTKDISILIILLMSLRRGFPNINMIMSVILYIRVIFYIQLIHAADLMNNELIFTHYEKNTAAYGNSAELPKLSERR
ncbi:hypothetical protein D3C78_1672860 [compost metagenome]